MAGREMELRNRIVEGADALSVCGRQQCWAAGWVGPMHSLRSLRPRHVINGLLDGNRETSEGASPQMVSARRSWEGCAVIRARASEESDTAVVPRKSANSWVTPLEPMEGRARG